MKLYAIIALTLCRNVYTFDSIYANTTSANHTIFVRLASPPKQGMSIKIGNALDQKMQTISVPASRKSVSAKIALYAGAENKFQIHSFSPIESIEIHAPTGKYYPCTVFAPYGSSRIENCDSGFCKPTGSKLSYLDSSNTASAEVHATIPQISNSGKAPKYIELDFTNNDVAFSSSWGLGSNSRNITLSVNGNKPVRLEVPLSGRHSELFGPGKGWWDTSTLGLTIDGWKNGSNLVVVGNEAGDDAFESYGADFVGFKLFD